MTRRNVGLFVGLAVMAGCMPDYSSNILQRSGRGDGDDLAERPPPPASPSAPPIGPQPSFGATVRQAEAPPPLSGGTLGIAPDGVTVVAADPDRDRLYVLDFRAGSTLRTIQLSPHDEPGRVAFDGASRAHIALRSGGAVVTIDLATAAVLYRREVCSAPRGIAYDSTTDVVHVACAGGELVTLPAADGAEIRRRQVARDLRDVVVVEGGIALSTFRDAAILRLENDADVAVDESAPRNAAFGRARVAWRMVTAPSGSSGGQSELLVAAQKAPESGPEVVVPPVPAAYYGADNATTDPCSANGPGPVVVDRNVSMHVPAAVLPVDIAATKELMAVAAAGNGHTTALPQIVLYTRPATRRDDHEFTCTYGKPIFLGNAQITSVSFAQNEQSGDVLVALSREPAALIMVDPKTGLETSRIALALESREDTGHAIFHSNSGVGVACASCHPDGRDDGHAWRSIELGPRRTPSLLGTVADTAPYHWNGEAKDMSALVQLTFQSRMRGPVLATDQAEAMDGWLRALRAPPRSKATEPGAVARGKQAFEGTATCSTCHSGAMRTNNTTVDVQTGGLFQVPSLIGVSWRAPHLHDGSAPSVRALLERGHGGATLPPGQIGDLAAFLDTL